MNPHPDPERRTEKHPGRPAQAFSANSGCRPPPDTPGAGKTRAKSLSFLLFLSLASPEGKKQLRPGIPMISKRPCPAPLSEP